MATLQSITDEVRKHAASVAKLATVLKYIDGLDEDDRERPTTSFLLTIYAHLIVQKNKAASKETFLTQAKELGTILNREVISADMASLSAQHLADRLSTGYETVIFQLGEIACGYGRQCK